VVAEVAALEPYEAAADAVWTDHPKAKEDEVVAVVRAVRSNPAVGGTTLVVMVRVEAEAMEVAVLGPSSS
jgi:hypothetical protein